MSETPPPPLVCNENGKPKPTFGNVLALMARDSAFDGRFRFNHFTLRVEILDLDTGEPRSINDADLLALREALWCGHEVDFSTATVHDACAHLAGQFPFHPVRAYLKGLSWDGKLRVGRFLTDYCRCRDDGELNATMSERFFLGCVARVMDPGCKLDTMLILHGGQGMLKSTAFRVLAGDPWFSDQTLDLKNKDASQCIEGIWLYEFGELEGVRRAEATQIKAWMSRQSERYRPPYARTTIEVPRQTVFVGTTNEGTFLADPTGARRFWVRSLEPGEKCDVEAIKRDRDQLWAEAFQRYSQGGAYRQWWLDDDEDARRDACAEQYRARDPWEDAIDAGLFQIEGCSSADILAQLGVPTGSQGRALENRLGAILSARGFSSKPRTRDGTRCRRWYR